MCTYRSCDLSLGGLSLLQFADNTALLGALRFKLSDVHHDKMSVTGMSGLYEAESPASCRHGQTRTKKGG